MKLQIYQKSYKPKDLAEFRKLLLYRHENKFGSFWLYKNEDECLALHINHDKANLWFAARGKTYWSKNPDFDGKEGETVEFVIDNYQLDDMPEETVISAKAAQEVFEEYFLTGNLSQKIIWL